MSAGVQGLVERDKSRNTSTGYRYFLLLLNTLPSRPCNMTLYADNYRMEVSQRHDRHPNISTTFHCFETGPENSRQYRYDCTVTETINNEVGSEGITGEWHTKKKEAKEATAKLAVECLDRWGYYVRAPGLV